MLSKRLLNVKEAARLLNISPNTLYSWVSQKRIPFVKLGRKTGFDPKDLEEWIEKHKIRQNEF